MRLDVLHADRGIDLLLVNVAPLRVRVLISQACHIAEYALLFGVVVVWLH